jgi:hypothetical protein
LSRRFWKGLFSRPADAQQAVEAGCRERDPPLAAVGEGLSGKQLREGFFHGE